MRPALPKLRRDLDCRVQTTANGPVLVVKDPRTRQFFCLKETERFVAEQLDGETPLEIVNQRVEEKFGASLAPDALDGFIKGLERNRLLEKKGKSRKADAAAKQGRFAGSALYLRFKLLDPDRILNRLIQRVQFCFTPQFVIFSAAIICTAIGVTIFNWSDVLDDAAGLYKFSTLPLLLATVFVVITAHEFAHGLTCKHFGGEVREMGFLLMYFQPAFYCNVSDAWFFPKQQRLLVSFAGPYFELFIWALATLAWRVTDHDTWINHVAIVVMATSGIKTLFNFNPLIKLDGYYLLSDYLDLPNLRKKSFRFVGDFVKKLGGLGGDLQELPPRQRKIYLAYGVTAWLASISILTYLGWAFGEYLILEEQRIAFFAFAGLIGVKFRSRFRRLFGRKREDAGSAPRSKSDATPKRRWLIRLAIAAAVAFVLFLVPMELRVAGSINVLPSQSADVRSQLEGIVQEVLVDEGQHVNVGDVIIRLVDRDVRSELQKTEGLIDESRARLRLLEAGSRAEEVELARTTVARFEEQLKFYRAKFERFELLNKQQLASMVDLEESKRLVASGESDLAEARKKLELLLAGSRPEEIEALRGMVASLETQRRNFAEQLRLMTVVSPSTGIVSTPSRQLREMRGQLVQKGDLITKVTDLRTITAEIAVSEKEIGDIRISQPVALKARAYPERIFSGKVTEIATTAQGAAAAASTAKAPVAPTSLAEAAKTANTILVTTEIDNSAELLKPGMTGMAKIYCGKRRIADLMMRRLSRTFRVEFWSWW